MISRFGACIATAELALIFVLASGCSPGTARLGPNTPSAGDRAQTPFVAGAAPTAVTGPGASASQSDWLAVHLVDVGQGEGIVVVCPDSKAVLVDAGPQASGVLNYIRGLGLGRVELAFATSVEEDHIGGLVDMLSPSVPS